MAGTNKPLKIILFLGTVRDNRVGLRVAKFMKQYLEKTQHEVFFYDPLELDLPLLRKPIHFYSDKNDAPPPLKKCWEEIKAADAYVLVSGEYNHCIPPALSNLLDYFPGSAYGYKPSAIVCYSPGIFGGMRAAIQLRAMLGELGCLSVSNIFGIPQVGKALNEDGTPLNDHMEKGAKKLIDQLDWHAHAMRNHRETYGLPQ